MPRSIYRSRLFWLGLLGLIFLLWGWWHSTQYRTILGMRTATGHAEVHSIGHVVATGEVKGLRPSWSGGWAFLHLPGMMVYADPKTGRPMADEFPVLPRFVEHRSTDIPEVGGSTWRVAVAYWFIVAVYGCAWAGACVAWRWWLKRKRSMERVGVA